MLKLSEYEVNIKIKLSAIWASVMSLYIYCDYFELYTPKKLESMINGTTLFGSGDQGALLGLSSIMLVTSLMICLSILLPATINKVLNILVVNRLNPRRKKNSPPSICATCRQIMEEQRKLKLCTRLPPSQQPALRMRWKKRRRKDRLFFEPPPLKTWRSLNIEKTLRTNKIPMVPVNNNTTR